MRRAIALLTLAGCGRIGFDPLVAGSGSDAGPDARLADAQVSRACATNPAYQPIGASRNSYRGLALTRWVSAQSACATDDADLAIIDDAAEATALGTVPGGVFVGIIDETIEGTWVTVEGDPAPYLLWAIGEPSGGTTENYGELRADARFNDVSTTSMRQAWCECQL